MLQTTLAEFKSEFDQFLLNFLDNKINESATINQTAVQNLQMVRKLVENGGKRVRPFLVYLGFGLGREIKENSKLEIFKVGAALELFHTFALIHDDLIDNSLIRRGLPTIEAEYQNFFEANVKVVVEKNEQGELDHQLDLTDLAKQEARGKIIKKMSVDATILAGDFAHTLADLVMNTVQSEEVRNLYYQMQFELVAGQLDDCFGVGASDLENLSAQKILNMLKAKSGNYSIQKPLMMGWKLAKDANCQNDSSQNMEKKLVENYDKKIDCVETELSKIGEDVGLVFQLTDDILGVFGKSVEMGKSNTSDLLEGKKTLLIFHAWQNSNTQNRDFIKQNLGNPQGDFKALQQIIIDSRALGEIQEMCQSLSQQAILTIQKIFGNSNSSGTEQQNSQRILEKMNNLESLIAETERTKEKTWDNQFYVQILLEFIEYLTSRKK